MASTIDSLVSSINNQLKVETSRAVHSTIIGVLKGKGVDPLVVADVVSNVIDNAAGNILGAASSAVNKTIANAVNRRFKNSVLGAISGNYAADMVKAIALGRPIPVITTKMAISIGDSISRDLYARLPASLTKNINVNILGTNFSTGISGVLSGAIESTVGAVVHSVFSGAPLSIAALPSIPGLNSLDQILDDPISVVDTIFEGIKIPEDFDLGRYADMGVTAATNKLIELADAGIGTLTGIASMAKDEYEQVQDTLVAANKKLESLTLGGTFEGIESVIDGVVTTSGARKITKDLSSMLNDVNSTYGIISKKEQESIDKTAEQTAQIGKQVAAKAATKAQTFNPLSDDQIEKLTNVKEGFKDPNAKYPLPEYKNKPETNKLATRDSENTIVDQKNANRMLGAQLPNGASWDQPVSPYNARYPFNHVTETESGHVLEMDDTPEAERIHIYHKSGSFTEVDALGNRVDVIRGSSYTIVDANGYISIHGKANVSINGSCNVSIGADANIEVTGNTYLNCFNNTEINTAGRLKLTAGEGIDIRSPEVFIDADRQLNINCDMNTKIHTQELNLIVDTDWKTDVHNDLRTTVDGSQDTHVKGSSKLFAKADIHQNAEGKIFHSSKGDFNQSSGGKLFSFSSGHYNIKSGGNFFSSASGSYDINAGGAFNADGSMVWINSNKSSKASEGTKAESAKVAGAVENEYCSASYIRKRKSNTETIIRDSSVKTQTSSDVANRVMPFLASGKVTIDDVTKADLMEHHGLDMKSIETKPLTMQAAKLDQLMTNANIIIPDELPLNDVALPGNWKLSPYFTLEDLTTKTANPYPLEPLGDIMTISKVVANLQYLALNVLEPIYAARPDMIIDTAFKPIPATAIEFERNNFGLSVSLDFKDAISFDDYFDIASIIQHVIPYDEMILWYLTADFTRSHKDTALIVINVPGVFYPDVFTPSDASMLQKWSEVNNKQIRKTWFNGGFVCEGFAKLS